MTENCNIWDGFWGNTPAKFSLLCLRIQRILALGHIVKYFIFNWNQNQTFKTTWAEDNWRPKDCVAEDCNIKEGVWGEAPAKFLPLMFENFKHFRALCCQFKYLTFNWHQNQTFKATYTWAVDNWWPKDCVAEDCNIKDSVWGKAPAKFLTIMFENFEQIESLSGLMFDI